MAKKVVPFRPRRATPSKTVSERQSRVTIRLGKQRYALDITCQANVFPPEPAPTSRLVETKFIRLREPVALTFRLQDEKIVEDCVVTALQWN